MKNDIVGIEKDYNSIPDPEKNPGHIDKRQEKKEEGMIDLLEKAKNHITEQSDATVLSGEKSLEVAMKASGADDKEMQTAEAEMQTVNEEIKEISQESLAEMKDEKSEEEKKYKDFSEQMAHLSQLGKEIDYVLKEEDENYREFIETMQVIADMGNISEDDDMTAVKYIEAKGIKKYLSEKQIKEGVKKGIISCLLEQKSIPDLTVFKGIASKEDLLADPEIIESFKKSIKERIESGAISIIKGYILQAGLPEDEVKKPAYAESIKMGIQKNLEQGDIYKAEGDLLMLGFTEEEIKEELKKAEYIPFVKKGVVESLKNEHSIKYLLDSTSFLLEELDTPDIIHSFAINLAKNFKAGGYHRMEETLYYVPEKRKDEVIKESIMEYFLIANFKDPSWDLRRMIEWFKLPTENFDLIKFVKTETDDKKIQAKIFSFYADEKQWKEEFGEEEINSFLDVLPKKSEEKRNAFTHNNYDRTSKFLQFLSKDSLFVLDKENLGIAKKYINKFGLAKSKILYEYFNNIKLFEKGLLKELPEEQKNDGIVSMEILETKYNNLKNIVFGDKPMMAENLENLSEFEISLLSSVTGKSTHRFDDGRPNIQEIIENFKKYSKNEGSEAKEYVPVPKEYTSAEIEVSNVDISFDVERVKEDFDVLKQEIFQSFDMEVSDKDKINKIKESVLDKIKIKIQELEKNIQTKPNKFLQAQLENYQNLEKNITAVDNYDSLMEDLLEIERGTAEKLGLYSEMRQIIFRKILEKNYGSNQAVENIHSNLEGEITSQSILSIVDLVDNFAKEHVLNLQGANSKKYWSNETWKKIKDAKDKSKMVNLLKIFSPHLDNLKNEVANFEVKDKGEQFKIKCIPDRGLVGEMSGYLADVCYTKETKMLERYPNVIPFKFVVDDGVGNKNFIGSVLLFELMDNQGEKVALLRGFDVPDENDINISKFIEKFFNQVQVMTKKRNIKKVIIPGLSGAISNYRRTVNHMTYNYAKPHNHVDLSKKFAFNEYDITNNCYTVREN